VHARTGTVSGDSTRAREMVSNMYMELLPPGRLGTAYKVGALAIVLCAVTGIAWILWLRSPAQGITDQDVLREAVAEWHRAGEPGSGPNYQIFEQQAAQGYYDDAAATSYLFRRPDDKQWAVVELAKIRAENGDIPGAKSMIAKFAGSDLGNKALKTIAQIQADQGDLPGALETSATSGDSNDVLLVFARRQIANADLDGALKTAEQMDSQSAGQVFYEVGDALHDRGEQKRARELASHMSNRKLAALFLKLSRFTLWPQKITSCEIVQADPCAIAYHGAPDGSFAEVDALIEQNKCSYVSFVATQQYAVDPAGAERLLHKNANSQDLAFGLDQFAVAAAKKGNIAEALRFLENLQSLGIPGRNVVLAQARSTDAVHEIARYWSVKDGPKVVLKWAHSRPTTEERTWALIGVAEALGHARPQR
jgi:hypothetical protein